MKPDTSRKGLRLRAAFLAILLIAIASGSACVARAAPAITPTIPTEGGTWTNAAITILIIPQTGQPWFRDSYTFDVNRAIARWSQSIIAYTDAYGAMYMRKLSFTTCVAGVNDTLCSSPDIQVQFIQSFGPNSAGLGLTSIKISNSLHTFTAPTTTALAAYDPSNTTQLSDRDMVNIASHEFGHALGLGHATVSGTGDGTFELMFLSYQQPVGSLADSLEAPSTLDFYALSYIYDWLATSSTLSGPGHAATSLSLPSGIAYTSVYPYAEQIQMLENAANISRLEVIILVAVAVFLVAIVLTLGVLLSRKKMSQTQPINWQVVEPPGPPGT